MNFTADREEFAAKQSDIQKKDENYLRGSARAALRRFGKKGWYSALLKRVEQVARTSYRRESGNISSDDLRARLKVMREDLIESLEKTKDPKGHINERAEALAKSLSSLANAVGIEAASHDDEDDIGLEWVTMHDDKVRTTHREADGQVRRPHEKYDVGGYKMSRPGDTRVPIELWINCRCALRPVRMDDNPALTAAATEYEDQGICVFLLPAADDPINDLSSESVAHVTVAFMGMKDDQPDLPREQIAKFLSEAAADFKPIEVAIKERGILGGDEADVAFLDDEPLVGLRESIVENEDIAAAMSNVEQYPDWLPHLTLGYPDSPAAEGDLPSTIRLDRLALYVGREHHEYQLGGEMPTDEIVDDVAIEDEIDEINDEDIDDMEASVELVQWHGVLAPEGVLTGDRRKFNVGSLRWRDLPLPLSNQKTNMPGHDGSVVTGRIDRIWRDENNLLHGEGVFLATPEADEHINLIAEGAAAGVSVDVDDATMSFEDEDGNEITFDSEFDPEAKIISVMSDGRICGATGCAIPAFAEAYIALGPHPNPPVEEDDTDEIDNMDDYAIEDYRQISTEERKRMAKNGQALPDGSYPIANLEDLKNAIQAIGRAKDPAKAKAHIKKRARALGHADLIPEGWTGQVEEFVKTEDGPGWLTHPVDTERLRRYWTKGKGAAKIRWGIPGDFNRCRAQLAKYIKPIYLSGYCANRHYDALGFWPGRPVSAETVKFGGGEAFHLVASVETERWTPPREFYNDPGLLGPTRLTVTEDGRVFGHLAEWGVCHIGIDGVCTTPPYSETDYAHFAKGMQHTTDGDVRVGVLTMGCGHAGPNLSARAAAAHYDNTDWIVATVAIGEDDHGIWFSGAVKPTVSQAQIDDMRAVASVSGDWRYFGDVDNLELVAGLVVNVPGFPISQTQLAASGGRQTALVASGIVLDEQRRPIEEIVGEAIENHMAMLQRREAMAALAVEAGRDPASKMAALAATRK